MDTTRLTDAGKFLDRTLSFLEENEAENLLALGILVRLAARATAQPSDRAPATSAHDTRAATDASSAASAPLMLSVEENESIRLVCLMTPPHRLILSCPETAGRAVMIAACRAITDEELHPPGALGPRKATERFVSEWCRATGCESFLSMRQMIFRLDAVNDVASAPGHLIAAKAEHGPLVADWVQDFFRAVPEETTREQAISAAAEAIARQRVYLWMAPGPVSMAAWTRPTKHCIAVSWVYTPPLLRSHGYATSAVAALSRLLLRTGYRFCTLYTDLSNPTSNNIYRKIGYVALQESVVYDFR